MSTITCNEVIKDNVKCKNSGFEPSFVDLGGADAWIRHCNATTRQQISVYSKLTFACLYLPHLEKWGYKKIFFARSARESCFVPLTFRIAEPPLVKMTNFRLRGCIPVASWQRGVLTQSIYRLWLCSNAVLPEYVSTTGPRQKNIYICICGPRSLSGGALLIFNVCDVVVKQLLGLPRFLILLLIVYDHINTICAII